MTEVLLAKDSEVLKKADNLSGLADVATARTNLALGTMAVQAATDYLSKAGNLNGLADAATARANLGLGNVDNTSDSTKNTATATLENKTIKGTKETVFAIVDGASVDIDPANGGIQTWVLGGSRTPTATNFAAGQSVLLAIDDGSANTITWSSINPSWIGGVAPTLATTGYTFISLWKLGSTIYASHIGNA